MVELLRGDRVHVRAEAARPRRAAVARAGIDDDDLHLVVDLLGRDRLETAHQVGAPVLDRDDDRDHASGYSAGAVVSRRSGMVSSARKNAPKTIWMPSPSAVTSSAVS